MGFVLVGLFAHFEERLLLIRAKKKRSYLLDPLEISTTFIYFAIAIIVVVVFLFIIISHGFVPMSKAIIIRDKEVFTSYLPL